MAKHLAILDAGEKWLAMLLEQDMKFAARDVKMILDEIREDMKGEAA